MSEKLDNFEHEFDPSKHIILYFDVANSIDPDLSKPEIDRLRTYHTPDSRITSIPGGMEVKRSEDGKTLENITLFPAMDHKTLKIIERNLNQLDPLDRMQFYDDFRYGLPHVQIDLLQQSIVFSVETAPLVLFQPETGAQIREEIIDCIPDVRSSSNNFFSNNPDQDHVDGSKYLFFEVSTQDPENRVRDDDGKVKSALMIGRLSFVTADYHKLVLSIKYLDELGQLTENNLRKLIDPNFKIELEEDVEGGEEKIHVPIVSPDTSMILDDDEIPIPIDFQNSYRDN